MDIRERGNFNGFSNFLFRNHFILGQDMNFFNNKESLTLITINKFGLKKC